MSEVQNSKPQGMGLIRISSKSNEYSNLIINGTPSSILQITNPAL